MPSPFAIPIDYEQPVPDIQNRCVCVHVSGGAASAIAAMRCIEWYGRDRVTLVNADTGCESAGNYALVDALETAAGIPIVRLNQGKDIWDVFDEHGVMRMQNGACKASIELKQKPLDAFTHSSFAPDEVVVAVGMSSTESDRQSRLTRRIEPYQILAPLNVSPRLSECEIVAELARYGLPESMAYNLGYTHDNCKGGCVLAGQAQWVGLLSDDPEHFAYCERRETPFYERTGFTVLKDRRGGETKSYPLSQLRADREAGRKFRFRTSWRSTCGCMMIGENDGDADEEENQSPQGTQGDARPTDGPRIGSQVRTGQGNFLPPAG